jgi:alpha-galactosidase/6-phospho-beta-glucosidase family protein
MMQLVIILGLLVVLVIALSNRKREAKAYKQEEADEDNGKYWDATEQSYRSKREQETDKNRKEVYLQGSANMLKKDMLAFIYNENPELIDLDSKGFAELNKVVSEHAQSLIQDVSKVKRKYVR